MDEAHHIKARYRAPKGRMAFPTIPDDGRAAAASQEHRERSMVAARRRQLIARIDVAVMTARVERGEPPVLTYNPSLRTLMLGSTYLTPVRSM